MAKNMLILELGAPCHAFMVLPHVAGDTHCRLPNVQKSFEGSKRVVLVKAITDVHMLGSENIVLPHGPPISVRKNIQGEETIVGGNSPQACTRYVW